MKKISSSDFADIEQGLGNNFYEVKSPAFSSKEFDFADFLIKEIIKESLFKKGFEGIGDDFNDNFYDTVVSFVQVNRLNEKLPSKSEFTFLSVSLEKLLEKIRFVKDKKFFADFVLHNSVGLKKLSFFSMDDDLEELMVNSFDKVFVFHKRFGMCKTSVVLGNKDLLDTVQRIALTIGKDFNSKNPLLDARLPDGSRVNATLSELSPIGGTITIRKFSSIPLTILDLIESNTITSEAAAFLWLMVDGFGNSPRNILIAGGTASGKTTFLNILSNFVRLNERIVSIEDTIELSLLSRDNWVPLEARSSVSSEVSMDALLRNAMRMRSDRIIVGEVRGPEALTLFTAMDTGHQGCLGTIHSNNARETILKLQERPLSVPQAMLPLLDIIVIMQRRNMKDLGAQRRVMQIVELSRMEDKVLFGNLFEYDDKNDVLKRTDLAGAVVEEMASKNSMNRTDISNELKLRKGILEWMIRQDIRKPMEVLEVIESYYYNPDKVLSTMHEFD